MCFSFFYGIRLLIFVGALSVDVLSRLAPVAAWEGFFRPDEKVLYAPAIFPLFLSPDASFTPGPVF